MITVRPAGEPDASALRVIAVAAYHRYVPRIGRAPAPMTADYTTPTRGGLAWIAVEDGAVTGFVILIPRPGYLLLDNVAVLPAAQGRGIGARLLALTEDQARTLGLTEIRLYTNEAMTENLAYYPRHGYTELPGRARRLPASLLPQAPQRLTVRPRHDRMLRVVRAGRVTVCILVSMPLQRKLCDIAPPGVPPCMLEERPCAGRRWHRGTRSGRNSC